MNRALKPKRCRICERTFTPISSMSKACSVHCALEYSRRIAAKKAEQEARTERKKTREAKERLKTRGDHLREAQAAFNKFVRLRDANEPCISCGRSPTWQGQWDAGHFMSRGSSPSLRFDPANVHKQCLPCNRHKSGALVEYRAALVWKIGLSEVERLEGPQEPKKYTIEEIKQIKEFYRAEVRRMKREA